MKRSKKFLFTAAAFAGVLNMNGCVYGPPPEGFYSDVDNSSIIGFEPSDNNNQNVYGPPPEDIYSDGDDSSIIDFDPSDNKNEDVYGPPPFDMDEFDPAENIVPTVYGPPSDPEMADEITPPPETEDKYEST